MSSSMSFLSQLKSHKGGLLSNVRREVLVWVYRIHNRMYVPDNDDFDYLNCRGFDHTLLFSA